MRAVELGLADGAILNPSILQTLDLKTGVDLYLAHVARPEIVGGAGKATHKRYRTVFGKFRNFASENGIIN